jgi:GntR family transcriptional regulator
MTYPYEEVEKMKLDKRSTQPLYAQLKELLNERIRQGVYQPGQQIPSELALCEELNLSRPTVRQAISELVTEGILVIVKGKGTFVASEAERIELKGFNAFAFSFLSARELDGLDDLSISTMESNPPCWTIKWQLENDGQIFAICQSVIPVAMFPELAEDIRHNRRMIEITANKYAYLPQKASCRILVRPAATEEARQLDIARNSPVLVASSRLTSRSGNICETVTAIMRADLVTLGLDAGRS